MQNKEWKYFKVAKAKRQEMARQAWLALTKETEGQCPNYAVIVLQLSSDQHIAAVSQLNYAQQQEGTSQTSGKKVAEDGKIGSATSAT